MKPQGHVPAASPIGAHEGADLDVPLITRIAAILAIILVLLVLGTLLTFHFYEKQYPDRTSEAAPIETFAELPPAPRLQVTPRLDLQQLRVKEDTHLVGYGWIDRAKGIARLPIERAMMRWVELQNAPAAGRPISHAPGGPVPLNPLLIAPAPAPGGVTELQMRRQKAQGGTHAP